jgi:hypothetical protein
LATSLVWLVVRLVRHVRPVGRLAGSAVQSSARPLPPARCGLAGVPVGFAGPARPLPASLLSRRRLLRPAVIRRLRLACPARFRLACSVRTSPGCPAHLRLHFAASLRPRTPLGAQSAN